MSSRTSPVYERRRKSLAILAAFSLVLSMLAQVGFSATGLPEAFALVGIVDDGGANDAVGQNDLTRLAFDDTGSDFLEVTWSWDEPSAITGGGQAVNACAMFDTDADGNVNYSLCLEVSEDQDPTSSTFGDLVVSTPPPPDGDTWFPHWIECSDAKDDRCTQPNRLGDPVDLPDGLGATSCTVAVTATDPFDGTAVNGPGSDYPDDIEASCLIDTDLLPIPGDYEFVNVCSYPSAGNDGNNNPFDCIVTPGSGFLTIIKVADPDDTTEFNFTLDPASGSGQTQFSIEGSGTVVERIPVVNSTGQGGVGAYTLLEAVPDAWQLDGAACSTNGTDTGTASTPLPAYGETDAGLTGIDIQSGQETICTFTNSVTFVPEPSLTIVKVVDLTEVSAPGTLTYTITVDNTGNVDLTNVVLGDVFAGGATLTSGDDGDGILQTTETWVYTADYEVTQADINAGTALVNVATVDTDQTDEQQDDATTTITQDASLTIVKVVDLTEVSAPGTLTYTITVDNTGNVDLTNVVLGDVFAGGATLTSGDDGDGILQTTETWVYTADYEVTQADINAGTALVNVATVDTDQTDEQQDDATTTITQDASLTIVKVVDLTEVSAPGTLTYTITVDNTGNVDLTNVVLGDVFAGGATLTSGDDGDGILQTTETWVYTADYEVTQADINAGTALVNVATVDTDQTDEQQDDATTTITQDASLTIVKVVDLTEVSAPGTLTYTITVDNTGNVDLTNVVLGDVFAGGATLTSGDDGDGILQTTETWVYTADYEVTQADINAGTALVNVATVDTDQTDEQQDDATTTITQDASLTIVKVVDLTEVSAPGTLTYTITVDNTGNVDLTNVVLGDVFAGGATLTSGDDGDGILQTTETWVYTADYEVTQADINAGTALVNVATVDTDQTDEQQDDATTTITQDASLTIVKVVDLTEVSAPGTLTYTITVDNTGNVDLTNVVLGDVFAGGATLTSGDDGDGILQTTETWVYTADYEVTQADINAGTALVNVATVDTDQTDEQQDDATTTITQDASLTIVKVVDLTEVSAPGTLTYTITVDNTGNVDLTNVVLGDVFAGGATLTSGDDGDGILQTTETWVYTADYEVTQADINAGTALVNVATVDTDQTDEQQDDATTTITQDASLTIVKVVDLTEVSAPGTLTYTITVDNTGNVDLTNVVLGDVFAGGATLTSGDDGDGILQTTETWVYTADYEVTQADINAGTALVNVATVDTDQTDEQQDDATTTITQDASLTIVKVVDLTEVSAPGTLTYTITVDNTGNVDLTNVVLGDVFAGGATLTSGDDGDGILQTTETWVYTADYEVTQADINAGTALVNVATVDTDQTDEQQDDATTTITQDASLTIVKVVDLTEVSAPGTLTYTITVDNTGNVDLTNVVLGDVFAGGATLTSGDDGDGILQTTETWVYTADYEVTQADINAGTALVNVATVDTDQTDEQQDDATTTITQDASLTIVKVVDLTEVSAPGTLTYTITVDNTGNVDLTNVVLGDVFAGGATLTSGDDGDGILQTTETWVYTADYEVTQADINAGTALVNVATVDTDQTDEQQDDATTTITQDASLTIVKVVDLTEVSAPGTLTYTITVDNTGNVDLTNVVLGDVFAGGATLTSGDDGDGILQTTETWVYTADYEVTQADINAGTALVNVATVDTDQTDEQQDDATTTITQDASLTIVKVVDLTEVSAPGTLTYTITVDNTGNVDLTNVVLGDVFAGGATLTSGDDGDGILQTTETWVYTADYEVTQADINAGTALVNVATVDTDQTDEQQDDATTTITQDASLTIVKVVDLTEVSAPGTLTYTITVDNTGNVDLTNVVLGDVFAGGATLTSGDDGDGILQTTETWVYTADYEVTQADINAGTALVNVATVDTDQTDEQQDDATTTITQDASLTIVKVLTNNADEDGSSNVTLNDTLTYTITATNAGNVTLTNVVVSDDLTGDSTTCASVAPGGTCVLTVTYVVAQADVDAGVIVNIGTADSDETEPVTDPEEVPVVSPGLAIEKVFDPGTLGAGDSGSFTITVTNTGNSALTNVTVDDVVDPLLEVTSVNPQPECSASAGQTVDCTFASLDPGESETVTVIFDVAVTLPPTSQYGTTNGSEFKFVFVNGDVLEGSAPGPVYLNGVMIDEPGTGTKNDYYFDEGGFELHLSCSDSFTGGWGDYGSPNPDDNPDWQIASYSINRFKKGDFFRSCGNVVVPLHINNTAFADSDQTDPISDDASVVIIGDGEVPFAELSVDKPAPTNADEDGSGSVTLDDTLTYTITATNTGTATLNNVVVTDSLVTPDMTTCASLTPGETCVLVGTYVVAEADVEAGEIVNEATADSDQTDPVTDDETVPVVVDTPALEIDKSFGSESVGAGESGSFAITVTNTGSSTLNNVKVTDAVDPLLEVTDVGPASECAVSSGQAVDCTFDSLEPGESVVVTVTFDVAAAPTLPQTPQYGTTKGSEFLFVFVNGSVLEGSATGDVYLDGVPVTPGDKKNDYFFEQGGFELHLSCSDSFTGGWGDYGSPNPDDNPEWQIESYSIARYNKGAVRKTCGGVVVPYSIDNTAYAVSDETGEVSDDASVVIGGS